MIIGSGLTGLTIADVLETHGFDVVIVDKGPKAGGRMAHGSFQEANDYEYDHGAQFFLRSELLNFRNKWIYGWKGIGSRNGVMVFKKWYHGFENSMMVFKKVVSWFPEW